MLNKKQKKDLAQYTLHGKYNPNTQKPYIEIKKNGEHYAYAPWNLFKNQMKIGDLYG